MSNDDGKPEWDEGAAQALVGQTVLVGLTYAQGDEVIRQEQLHGVIVSADSTQGFEIALKGSRAGDTYWLPPHISAFHPARKGEYRLRSTGEVVVDPDLLSHWTVNPPQN